MDSFSISHAICKHLVFQWILSKYILNPTTSYHPHYSVQFSSVTQSCLTLCSPMDCSTPGFPVHQQHQSLLKLMSIELVMPSVGGVCNFLCSVSPQQKFEALEESLLSSVLLGKTKDSTPWRSEGGSTQKTREERLQSF